MKEKIQSMIEKVKGFAQENPETVKLVGAIGGGIAVIAGTAWVAHKLDLFGEIETPTTEVIEGVSDAINPG